MIKHQTEMLIIKICFVVFIIACVSAAYYYRAAHKTVTIVNTDSGDRNELGVTQR
jgi:uncharacterized protein YpmB